MKTINRLLVTFSIVALLGLTDAKALSLPDGPLFLDVSIPPNVILTYDDSGSMAWSYVPDSICGEWTTKRVKSSTYNALYYNPNITYEPGVDMNGNSLGNANFRAAWEHGYTKAGGTRDLQTNYQAGWENEQNHSSCAIQDVPTTAPGPTTQAYYYRYTGPVAKTASDLASDLNYTLVTVNETDAE